MRGGSADRPELFARSPGIRPGSSCRAITRPRSPRPPWSAGSWPGSRSRRHSARRAPAHQHPEVAAGALQRHLKIRVGLHRRQLVAPEHRLPHHGQPLGWPPRPARPGRVSPARARSSTASAASLSRRRRAVPGGLQGRGHLVQDLDAAMLARPAQRRTRRDGRHQQGQPQPITASSQRFEAPDPRSGPRWSR